MSLFENVTNVERILENNCFYFPPNLITSLWFGLVDSVTCGI